jgi:hypothetical protein
MIKTCKVAAVIIVTEACDGTFKAELLQWQHTNHWTVISRHNTAIEVNESTRQKTHT